MRSQTQTAVEDEKSTAVDAVNESFECVREFNYENIAVSKKILQAEQGKGGRLRLDDGVH